MSHIHFTSTEKYRQRIIQMGEKPENVFCFGAPGLDNVYHLELMGREEIIRELKIPEGRKIGVVTYHPVTLEDNTAESEIAELLEALRSFKDIYWIFTLPNADTNGRVIIEKIEHFAGINPDKCKVITSLGRLRYLSLLRHASVMAGNSSSGLVEAPSFELPVVNIGDRQAGRVRGINVIDIECKRELIAYAIKKALSGEFKSQLRNMQNPYGQGDTSLRIVEKLKEIALGEKLIKKSFCERFN